MTNANDNIYDDEVHFERLQAEIKKAYAQQVNCDQGDQYDQSGGDTGAVGPNVPHTDNDADDNYPQPDTPMAKIGSTEKYESEWVTKQLPSKWEKYRRG